MQTLLQQTEMRLTPMKTGKYCGNNSAITQVKGGVRGLLEEVHLVDKSQASQELVVTQ